MSVTFVIDPLTRGEPHTRVLHDTREVGIIVYDESDDVFDIWIAVQDSTKIIGWRWLHFAQRPGMRTGAERLVLEKFPKIQEQFKLHYHP